MQRTVLFLFGILLVPWVTGQILPGRSGVVQLFEWKWTDIADECERWLGPKGFAAVQLSPPTENHVISGRPWWERYQPISYLFTTRSGTETELADMISRCNAVGVRIFADAVINHMTGPSPVAITGTGGSQAWPNDKNYPAVPYSVLDFNDDCDVNNYQDSQNVRNCELVKLKDLNQRKSYVKDKIVEMMNRLIAMGVAGFHIDAAKYMWPIDLEGIFKQLNDLNTAHGFLPGTRPFIVQEVNDLGGEAVSVNDYTYLGRVTEFKFSYEIGRVFRGKNELKWLVNWGEDWNMINRYHAVTFVDNQDLQRQDGLLNDILSYKQARAYKMATAFHFAHPYSVFPRMMSSFDFTDTDAGPPADANGNIISPGINPDDTCSNGWVCEHRWRQMYNMVEFRNVVQDTDVIGWWDNGNNQIAFCRGTKGFIAFNNEGLDLNALLQTCLPPGTYCDVISGSLEGGACTGKSVEVRSDSKAIIDIAANDFDLVLAIHINAKI